MVTLFVIFFLSRLLSQPARNESAQNLPKLTKVDLETYTRILGAIYIDTSLKSLVPSSLSKEFFSIDTMILHRELRDALARLTRLNKRKEIRNQPLSRAATSGYIGFCYYELAQPREALRAFQEGLELLRNATGPRESQLRAWLAFNAGYIFQYYSYPESALTYYQLGERALSSTDDQELLCAGPLFNNLGVAAATKGMPDLAKSAYIRALTYIDTSRADEPGLRLKKNLREVIPADGKGIGNSEGTK